MHTRIRIQIVCMRALSIHAHVLPPVGHAIGPHSGQVVTRVQKHVYDPRDTISYKCTAHSNTLLHSPTHSLTHALTHSFAHPPTHC